MIHQRWHFLQLPAAFLLWLAPYPLHAADPYQEEADSLRKAIQLKKQEDPPDPSAQLSQWHTEQADAYFAKQDYLLAETHLKRALELRGDNANAKQLLADVETATKQHKQRQTKKTKLVIKAIEAERRGKKQDALNAWKQAAALDPSDERIQEALDTAQARLNSVKPVIYNAAEFVTAIPPKALTSEYRVSVGDVIEVFVWQQGDLSRDVIVRPDGRLSMPLAGDVQAAGLTLTEVDQAITDRLRTYIRFPDVSLAIKRFGGTKTIVLGEVNSPGIYIPAGEGRALEVIAMAGGFKEAAVKDNVMLIRGGMAQPQIAKLNLDRVLTGGILEENVALQPNDILFVPKRKINSIFDFMDDFYPHISEILVGQSVAAGFGADPRIRKSDRPR